MYSRLWFTNSCKSFKPIDLCSGTVALGILQKYWPSLKQVGGVGLHFALVASSVRSPSSPPPPQHLLPPFLGQAADSPKALAGWTFQGLSLQEADSKARFCRTCMGEFRLWGRLWLLGALPCLGIPFPLPGRAALLFPEHVLLLGLQCWVPKPAPSHPRTNRRLTRNSQKPGWNAGQPGPLEREQGWSCRPVGGEELSSFGNPGP